MKELDTLKRLVSTENPEKSLIQLLKDFPEGVVFSTSLGWEDQVISHLIFSNDLPVEVFTLDTGRLFNETYSVLSSTISRYKKPIKVYYPQHETLEKVVTEKGPFSFYESVENRKECCFIRKVEPLKRALAGKKIWITGLRAEQSENRQDLPIVEWDEGMQIIKYHPLLSWTLEDVKSFIKQHTIPYNVLHDKGFVSIGCAPCTRAVAPGDSFRAGRWWWEDNSKKECGLHHS
jgi:phosphoadenosine phosphosulfate reductase